MDAYPYSVAGSQARRGTLVGQVMGLLAFSLLFTAGGAVLGQMMGPGAIILSLVGLSGASSARLTGRGSFVRDTDNTRVAVVAEMVGRVGKGSFGDWKAGESAGHDYEMTLTYFRLTVGGVETHEIDIENMIRRVGGVDQLAGIRADIGA